jgi:hypothetical protein
MAYRSPGNNGPVPKEVMNENKALVYSLLMVCLTVAFGIATCSYTNSRSAALSVCQEQVQVVASGNPPARCTPYAVQRFDRSTMTAQCSCR